MHHAGLLAPPPFRRERPFLTHFRRDIGRLTGAHPWIPQRLIGRPGKKLEDLPGWAVDRHALTDSGGDRERIVKRYTPQRDGEKHPIPQLEWVQGQAHHRTDGHEGPDHE
jgi:hypothetical protein